MNRLKHGSWFAGNQRAMRILYFKGLRTCTFSETVKFYHWQWNNFLCSSLSSKNTCSSTSVTLTRFRVTFAAFASNHGFTSNSLYCRHLQRSDLAAISAKLLLSHTEHLHVRCLCCGPGGGHQYSAERCKRHCID